MLPSTLRSSTLKKLLPPPPYLVAPGTASAKYLPALNPARVSYQIDCSLDSQPHPSRCHLIPPVAPLGCLLPAPLGDIAAPLGLYIHQLGAIIASLGFKLYIIVLCVSPTPPPLLYSPLGVISAPLGISYFLNQNVEGVSYLLPPPPPYFFPLLLLLMPH